MRARSALIRSVPMKMSDFVKSGRAVGVGLIVGKAVFMISNGDAWHHILADVATSALVVLLIVLALELSLKWWGAKV